MLQVGGAQPWVEEFTPTTEAKAKTLRWLLVCLHTWPAPHTQQRRRVGFGLTPTTAKKHQQRQKPIVNTAIYLFDSCLFFYFSLGI